MVDVNGTRFHLFLAESDWDLASNSDGLEWTLDRGLGLRRRLDLRRGDAEPRFSFDDRRGADRDRYGTWWVVGPDQTTIEYHRSGGSSGSWPDAAKPLSSGAFVSKPAPTPTRRLGGLVVTDEHRLIVGLLDTPGFLVFDLVTGGPPRTVIWTASETFSPIDMARGANGGIYVLDADPTIAGSGRIWMLDRHLRSILSEPLLAEPSFVRLCDDDGSSDADDAGEILTQPTAIALSEQQPTAIASFEDGSFVVLDETTNTVRWYLGDVLIAELMLDTALVDRLDPNEDPSVRGYDIDVVDDGDHAVLYVSDAGGDQVFAFDVIAASDTAAAGFQAQATNYPLRRHTGRAIVASCGEVFFDSGTDWFPLLERVRPRFASSGTVITATLDGGVEGTKWHRVFLDGCIPAGTSVRVETRSSEVPDVIDAAPWRLEPSPYLRHGGTELPLDLDVAPNEVGRVGTWELLVQRTDGRYCQIRLTLDGNGGASPRIAAARITYARFSYLHEYLPAVYQERDEATRFLERYMANPEGLFTDLEERIANAQLLFDSRTVPDAYLDWLAGWIGKVFDADLTIERKRLFLAHAISMYGQRGTVPGLIRALTLVLSDCPELAFDDRILDDPFGIRIQESFYTRRLGVPIPDGPGEIGATIITAPEDRWTPELGAAVLHSRFRAFLVGRTPTVTATTVSPTTPSGAVEADAWREFLAGQLGLRSPDIVAGHLGLYQRFLLQRYRQPSRLQSAYAWVTTPAGFADVAFPVVLPAAGAALQDWFDFITLVVPIAESAHRFTVLLPVALDASLDEQTQVIRRAQRVVDVERPLHTTVDVRPYWAAFQLGDARLGIDTIVGQAARSTALVLGRDELATAHLTTFADRTTLACETCP